MGFKSLETFSLTGVNEDDVAVEYLLSNSPLKERLYLHRNDAFRKLKVVGPSIRGGELSVC